jgi:septal ring factor EnvC (AmiA/AmiB activator)
MSLVVFLPMLVSWLGMAAGALAQNNAAAVAAQEEAEDRYRRMAAQVTGLKEAQDLHQQQIASLEKSIRELSDQVARANNNNSVNNATQEKLSHLAEQIRKVDEARVTENKKIFETIDELHRILKNMASAPPPKRTSPPPPPAKEPAAVSSNEEGFEYLVRKDDTLSGIVQAYRQQNINVTRKMIMDANPTVNWDRLKVKQKIFIPKPKG